MNERKEPTERERNHEAVRRHRQKEKREQAEMHALYNSNEEKIVKLEKMADNLMKELKKPPRK